MINKDETIKKIKKQITNNPIILYMKGSPDFPSCGFSAKAAKILKECNERFAYIDILNNIDIRNVLPSFGNWPTFPQLWVNGNLIGGCDIMIEMYQNNELQSLIKNTLMNVVLKNNKNN